MDETASPEFALACACCRWPVTDAQGAQIRAAAAAVADWDRFLRVVKRHRIAGLVHHALTISSATVPPDAVGPLRAMAETAARQGLFLAAETQRLQTLFDAAGLTAVFVKGASLAKRAYARIDLKHSNDIDFLVMREDADAALRLLEAEGYRLWLPAETLNDGQRAMLYRHGHEVTLVHRKTRILAELHWALADNPEILKGVDASSPTQPVFLSANQGIRTLADADLFAYLCVHGALHGWSRLKWLVDVNAFLAGQSTAEIDALYQHADAKGAGLCVGQTLLLCRQLFGLDLPEALKRALEGSRHIRKLVAFARDILEDERDLRKRPFATTRVVLMHFRLGRGWRYTLRQCAVSAVELDDMLRYPLPAGLHFLYPLLRLPLWLWRRIHDKGLTRLPAMSDTAAGS